jgi:hypothetical protein
MPHGSSSLSLPMSAMQTFIPDAAKRQAAARPIPEAPPVTTATLAEETVG